MYSEEKVACGVNTYNQYAHAAGLFIVAKNLGGRQNLYGRRRKKELAGLCQSVLKTILSAWTSQKSTTPAVCITLSFKASLNEKNQLIVELETEVPGLVVHYSFDETNPDEFYPVYEKPLIVPKDALHVKVITYRNGKPIGIQINMPVEELLKRAKSKKG